MKTANASTRLVIAALVVLAAGCSSSSSSGGTGSGNDGGSQSGGDAGPTAFTADQLCALVTTADVSAATGTTMNAGVPSGVNEPSCNWQSPDATVAASISADVPSDVGKIPSGTQNLSGAHVDNVPNLGDAASFAAGGTGPTGTLIVAKGLRAISVSVGNSGATYDQPTQKSQEIALATAAVKNM